MSRTTYTYTRAHAVGVIVAVLAVFLAVLAPTAADASSILRPGIHDDAQILNGDPEVVFPTLHELHTKLIRVSLWWGGATGVARSRPAAPTRSEDPAYDWTRYDRVTRYAQEYGIQVVFTVVGTPTWANGGRARNVAPTNAGDLRNFVIAAARRYSRLDCGRRRGAARGQALGGLERAEQPRVPDAAVQA